MSSEQSSLDPQLIEQTKRQIQTLVNEIADISRTDIAPDQFYGELLPRIVTALAAVGGVVWTTEEQGRIQLRYQVNLQETRLAEMDQETQVGHARLLQKAMTSDEGLLVGPHSGGGEENFGGANPTDFLLVLCALKTELETVGVVEIFQRPDTPVNTQRGYLSFLRQMCELAGDFLKSRQLRHFSDRQVLWTQLEEFTRLIHASLNPREAAYTIANEGRRLIECDRVSVAIRKGDRCYVEAVSGQDMVDKRSNTIRMLNRLASVAVASGEPVWYTGDTSGMAPQVEEAVQEYADESHTKAIAVLPLKRPDPPEKDKERADDAREVSEPVGALIVEEIEDARIPPKMVQRTEVVCKHSGTAMANAMEHESLFLMPVWRTLGKSRWIVKARVLPKVVAGGVAVLVALVALIVVPGDFRLQGKGTLEPVDRRDVFAGVDGIVEHVYVDHGSMVKEGDKLLTLRNTDLGVRIRDAQGQLETAQKQIASINYIINNNHDLSNQQRSQLHGQLMEEQVKESTAQSQLALYRVQEKDLEVRAPMDGQVVTWDLKNKLEGRPVQHGQVLLRVAKIDPDSQWLLEIHMPEDRMGHIALAENAKRQRVRELARKKLRAAWTESMRDASGEELQSRVEERLAKVPGDKAIETLKAETGEELDERLDVAYILATDPGTTHYGNVQEMHLAAEVHGDEGSTVLIKVEINKDDLKDEYRRAGAAVTAKIECGRASLGYVYFHDVFAFVEKIWFRWF